MANKLFSRRLRQLRMEKGVDAKAMSFDLGMTKNYIYNIETERSYPSMTQFFSICEYFNIAPYDFLLFEPKTTGKQEELLDVITGWDNEKMDRLIAIAKKMKTDEE